MKPSTIAVAFLAPLLLFFLASSLISDKPSFESIDPTEQSIDQPDPHRHLLLVGTRVVLMTFAIAVFGTVILRSFPLEIDGWSVVAGVLGAALWIGICELQLEAALLAMIGVPVDWLGARSGVNPFKLYPEAGQRWLFLALRFGLLALLVPVAEELFLRGFLMRAIDAEAWTTLSLRDISFQGLVAGTIYGVLSHPSEFLAAAVWFSLISLLMVKTGRFWNCVVAHAITNLILGIYILNSGSWYLW